MLTKLKRQIKTNIKRYLSYRRNNWRIKYWEKVFQERNSHLENTDKILSDEEIAKINNFYSKYGVKVNPLYHQFYKYCKGVFNVKNIPDDIYYTYIDPFFNNWELAKFLDNKTYYYFLFSSFQQPEIVAYRQNGFWLNNHHLSISDEDVCELIKNERISFLKQATDSEGGKNIYVFNSNTTEFEIKNAIDKISGDIVIQKGLKQSMSLSNLNSSSVNTLRLLTLLRKDGSVKLCSTSLRMGINGAKVDNASSGGITVGVNKDGKLNSIAYSANGTSYVEHPTSHINFSTIQIPNYDKVVKLVKREAVKYPSFRLISWDIALNEKDEPVLIEANLKYGELEFHQLNNGPIFGEETEEILSEVFEKSIK